MLCLGFCASHPVGGVQNASSIPKKNPKPIIKSILFIMKPLRFYINGGFLNVCGKPSGNAHTLCEMHLLRTFNHESISTFCIFLNPKINYFN